MSITARPSGYFNGPYTSRNCPSNRAMAISKTAWIDAYVDLYLASHGGCDDVATPEGLASVQERVLADATERIRILKNNGIR
jgi:hypothetical protein